MMDTIQHGQSMTTIMHRLRHVLQEVVTTNLEGYHRSREIPRSDLVALADTGLFGLMLPESYGGLSMGYESMMEVIVEVASCSASIASLLTVHAMVGCTIQRWGDDAMSDHWLNRLASGECLAGFALSELTHGSDMGSMETTIDVAGKDMLMNGKKAWVSGGKIVDVLMVFAHGPSGHQVAVLPTDRSGVQVYPLDEFMGFPVSMMAHVGMENVLLSQSDMVGMPGFALSLVANSALDVGRFFIACTALGIMKACLVQFERHVVRRKQFKRSLSDFQIIKAKYTKIKSIYEAAYAMCLAMAKNRDSGDHDLVMKTNLCKYYCSQMADEVASDTLQVFGARGFTLHDNIVGLVIDAKVTKIIEGNNEIMSELIADHYLAGVRAQNEAS